MSARTVQVLFEAAVAATNSDDLGPLSAATSKLLETAAADLHDPVLESLRVDGLTETLRALAQQLEANKQANHAWPLIHAAAMLAPDSIDVRRTHALIATATLQDTYARADVAHLIGVGDDHGPALALYVQQVFADAVFNPLGVIGRPDEGANSEVPSRGTNTRTTRLRDVLIARLGQARATLEAAGADPEATWLVPEPRSSSQPPLSPKEWLDPEFTPLEVAHAARYDWAALGAIAALSGHDRNALYGAPSTPNMSLRATRDAQETLEVLLWRIRDRQLTGGRGSRLNTQGPQEAIGRTWRGLPVETLPPSTLLLAEAEVAHVCGLLAYLSGDEEQVVWPRAQGAQLSTTTSSTQ